MKKFKFFAVAIAAMTVAFASCSKEHGADDLLSGDGTYMSISIEVPPVTRATNDGAPKEQVISDIMVYVVGSGTMHTASYTLAADFDAPDGSGVRKCNKSIQTTVGEKTVYVVANPTNALKGQLTNGAAVTTNILAGSEVNYINGTYDGNQTSLTSLTMTGYATATATKKDADEAKANPVAIELTRNVAKVVVKDAVATVPVTGGTSTGRQFAMIAKAQNAYLGAQTNTAYYQAPADPVPATYFNYYSTLGRTDNTGATSLSWVNVNGGGTIVEDSRTAWYALENRPTRMLEGNTTAAIIKATFKPTDGTVVTAYDKDAATEAEKRTMGNYSTGNFYVLKADKSYWTEAAYTTAIGTPDFVATDFTAPYVNGVGYYYIDVMNGARVKGVTRNSYYQLEINSITGPGSPTELPDGQKPGDETIEETQISVSIKMLPWDIFITGHDLQ